LKILRIFYYLIEEKDVSEIPKRHHWKMPFKKELEKRRKDERLLFAISLIGSSSELSNGNLQKLYNILCEYTYNDLHGSEIFNDETVGLMIRKTMLSSSSNEMAFFENFHSVFTLLSTDKSEKCPENSFKMINWGCRKLLMAS